MPVVDLGPRAAAVTTPDLWHGLPRRIGLTRGELEHLAGLLSCPLPFEAALDLPPVAGDDLSPSTPHAAASVHVPATRHGTAAANGTAARNGSALGAALDDRLGARPQDLVRERLRRVPSHPHDPAATLERRGLVVDGAVEEGVRGALGLLATPELALDLDVRVDGTQVHAWHRQADGAVAELATADGVVFELAWFALEHWSTELGRVGRLPEDVELRRSALPPVVDLPFELLDAASEAARTHRPDLLPVLAQRYSGTVLTEDGLPLDAVQTQGALAAIAEESHGRLRALSAAVGADRHRPTGIVSWLLLADGWHSLRAHGPGEALRIELRLVGPEELATCLAPVLAEVAR